MAITLPFELPCAECRARPCAYYCEADAAYLCAPCDTLIHSANRLAGRHIRQTISYHPPDNACCPTAVPTSPANVGVTSSSYVPSMHQHQHHHPHSFDEADALVPDIANVALSSNSTGSTSGGDLAYVAGQYVQREAAVLAASAARQWPFSAVLTSNSTRADVSRRLAVGNMECSVVSDAALKKKYTADSNDDGNHSKGEERGEVVLHAKGCCAEMQEHIDTEKIEKRRERMAALQRFRNKRASRSFVKKVRYECRKQLADSRPRVKGRFVKKCEMSLYKKYGDDYRSYLHEMDSYAQKQDCVAPDFSETLHVALSDALDITDIVDMARPLSALS